MNILNTILTLLFDLLFMPFSGLAPVWGLTVLSLLAGVLMLWIFGKVSNQEKIRTIRDRIRGQLLAIRLFGDDLGLLFLTLFRLLRDNAIFLKHAFVPILIMLLPVLLILAQLNLRYSKRPLETGESAVVKVKLSDASLIDRGVVLEAPEGITVETPGVRIESLKEVVWRVRGDTPGQYRLRVKVGEEVVEKDLRVAQRFGVTSSLRTANLITMLLYPGEPPIDTAGVESIEIKYQPMKLRMFGWNVNWLLLFFVLSLVSGFAFRRVLGVEI